MTPVTIYSGGVEGHHNEYNILIENELQSLDAAVRFSNKAADVLTARRVFFPMIDGNWSSFILCALVGCVTGRRVGGLLLRPGECFRRGSFKYRMKYVLFRAFKLLPRLRIMTIMPFSLDPRFAEIAGDWVHDPQFWDCQSIGYLRENTSTALSREVVELAKGRKLMVSLGAQNRSKGFDYLCDIWLRSPGLRERYLMVAAGRVAAESRGQADRFRRAGGVVIDRFVSTAELTSLYAACDVVWAAYHPDYNQASGIVGRGFQFGVPIILRERSYMAALLRELGHAAIEIGYDEPSEAARRLLAPGATLDRRAAPVEITAAMRHRFVRKLTEALDIGV